MQVVAVGVSPGRFSTGPSVPFAASDARRFAQMLGPNAIALCDDEATRETVTRSIDELAAGPPDEPGLLILIAPARLIDGHFQLELANAPINSAELLSPFWQSGRDRLIVALDLARGLEEPETEWKTALQGLIDGFEIRPGRTLLVSDDGENASHVSGELQAGIWAYHLAEAFAGRDPRARELDGRLTARSLRTYLAEEMASSLGRAFSEPRSQTPLVLANEGGDVLAEPRVEPPAAGLPSTSSGLELRGETLIPVKQLAGFQKSIHTPPADTLDTSREWVLRLAEPDLRQELEQTVTRLRQEMGYTRRQLRASGPTHGGASILTPDFAVHYAVEQSAEKPQLAIFKCTVSEIRNLDILQRESLAPVFPKGFSQLYQPFQTPADIETLIDTLEEARLPAIARIDYPTDLAHCELTLTGLPGQVRIEPAGLAIASDSPLAPAELVRRYATIRELLR